MTTELRSTAPLHARGDETPRAPGTRQTVREPKSTVRPKAIGTRQGGRSNFASLQWMLAVGSIAAVVVGANGLALQDTQTYASVADTTPIVQAVAALPPLDTVAVQTQQYARTGVASPAMQKSNTLADLPDLSALALPPIPTLSAPLQVQPEVRQALPLRPVARSRSSR